MGAVEGHGVDYSIEPIVLSRRRRPTFVGGLLLWLVVGLVAFGVTGSRPLGPIVVALATSVLIVGTVFSFAGLRSVGLRLHDVSEFMSVETAGTFTLSVRQGWSDVRLSFPSQVLGPQNAATEAGSAERSITAAPTQIFAPLLRRGRYRSIPVHAHATDPFGVWNVSHLVIFVTPKPFWVCPELLEPLPVGAFAHGGDGSGRSPRSQPVGDATREVVPYMLGDRPNQIHWASTARRGELMSRRFDPPESPELSVLARLSGSGVDDVVCGRILGTIDAALADGARVRLTAMLPSGPVTEQIETRREAAKILAAAVPGTALPPAADSDVIVVDQSFIQNST